MSLVLVAAGCMGEVCVGKEEKVFSAAQGKEATSLIHTVRLVQNQLSVCSN